MWYERVSRNPKAGFLQQASRWQLPYLSGLSQQRTIRGNLSSKTKQNYPMALHYLFPIWRCHNCLNSSEIKARWLTSCEEIACIIYMSPWASRGVVICVDCLPNDIQIDCLKNEFWLLRQFSLSYSFPVIVRCRSTNRAEVKCEEHSM